MEYNTLKRNALDSCFSRANNMQKKAIFKVRGAVLIIAGAGSGKTTVLVNRIANMIRFGNAFHDEEIRDISPDEERFLAEFSDMEKSPENLEKLAKIIAVQPINPWNILAITFTNKAAGELRERLSAMLGDDADKINASTFHSACVKILRREIEKLGFHSGFTIYDDDDSKRLIRDIMKNRNIDEKRIAPKVFKNNISRLKDRMISAEDYAKTAEESGEFTEQKTAEVYADYQKALASANAVDFDDIIYLTVKLFENFPDVLSHYRNLYKYIMVDEYQDTNFAQYRLISLLAGDSGNLCVVGDDDQSIYRFRGATIENILSFEKQYKNSEVIRLEQNYRSTTNILNAANAVIKNNSNRKEKRLWSELGEGEKIKVMKFPNELSEGKGVADIISEGVKNGAKYSDYAILYRNNALSRTFETSLTRAGIPYKIVGGLRFYDRKEVKDILSYLALLNNPYDAVRFRRVINEPKRGIGDTTVDEIIRVSEGLGISPLDVCRDAARFETLSRKTNSLKAAANIFDELDELSYTVQLDELIDAVVEKSGYAQMLKALGDEGAARMENINELKSNALELLKEQPDAALPDFLEQAALQSDIDNYDTDTDRVSLMTMHSAKGLEFPEVFLAAAEDNVFPSIMSINNPTELEEERRLAYVAITRAKKQLYITHTGYRMLYGHTSANKLSTFVREIPAEFCDIKDDKQGNGFSRGMSFSKPVQKSFLKEQSEKLKTAAPVQTAASENFDVGDRVRHKIFGEGTVVGVKPVGKDAIITIDFDTKGTKPVMKNNARMEKIAK
ncbi:MAG: UvrD-helicase domain-containing protein [Oscillospiraceae bacterium]|nr:UvrD-helicase domain-containing protein [Oscillospiraceae bacterium]